MTGLSTNWRKLLRHPLSEAWGDMSEVEFEGLMADMKQHGYDSKQQILLYEGRVLDGWHRLRAAILCGVNMPTFIVYDGDDAQGCVVRRNLLRRHLDTSQRGLIAGRLANLERGGNRKNLGNNAADQRSNSTFEAGQQMNIGRGTVKAGKKVAVNGTPVLQGAVMDGTLSVSDAASVATEPPRVQNAAVKKVRQKKSKTAKAAVTASKGDADEGELPKLVDAEGLDVPKDAIPAFQVAKDIESLCREIDKVIGRVKDISKGPGGRLINFNSFHQQMKDAKGHLWANRPTHVCPYCHGKKPKCECCHGECWTAKHVWIAAPGTNGKGVK